MCRQMHILSIHCSTAQCHISMISSENTAFVNMRQNAMSSTCEGNISTAMVVSMYQEQNCPFSEFFYKTPRMCPECWRIFNLQCMHDERRRTSEMRVSGVTPECLQRKPTYNCLCLS